MSNWTDKNATPKPHDDYYLGFILKMAAAFSVDLAESTQLIYLERLRQLTAEQIQTAASRTIEEWGEASKMPTLNFILVRAYPIESFAPMEKSQLTAAGIHLCVTAIELHEWMQAGKDAQLEHIAKLHDDPEWRSVAQHLGARL